MQDVRIILSALLIALMLIYLLGRRAANIRSLSGRGRFFSHGFEDGDVLTRR
jgi:hypothetical protein